MASESKGMNETQTRKVETIVKALLHSAANPDDFKRGIAYDLDVDIAEVEAVIARVGGSPREISREALVDERTFAEARSRFNNPQAWRAGNHEEE